MADLNAAVIGLGIGKEHARALAAMDGVRLCAVADLDLDLARRIAAERGARAYGSGAELLAGEALDLVCVCTNPRTHLPLTQDAAGRGVHVFCEKPMASSLAHCDGMILACRTAGVKLMVGQKKRFLPAFRLVKEKLEGEWGPARWCLMRYALGRVGRPWFWQEDDGGGPLVENSVHMFDMMRFLLGEPVRVYAEGGNLFNAQWEPQLDTACVTVRFAGGAIAAIGCGQASEWFFASEGTYLSTDHALVEVTGPFDNPDRVRFARRDDPGSVCELPQPRQDAFNLELSHFVECLRTGAEPACTGEDARGSIAVCLAVKESIRRGQPVDLGTAA